MNNVFSSLTLFLLILCYPFKWCIPYIVMWSSFWCSWCAWLDCIHLILPPVTYSVRVLYCRPLTDANGIALWHRSQQCKCIARGTTGCFHTIKALYFPFVNCRDSRLLHNVSLFVSLRVYYMRDVMHISHESDVYWYLWSCFLRLKLSVLEFHNTSQHEFDCKNFIYFI